MTELMMLRILSAMFPNNPSDVRSGVRIPVTADILMLLYPEKCVSGEPFAVLTLHWFSTLGYSLIAAADGCQ